MTRDSKIAWIEPLKGIAMIGVIFEHWTSHVPHQSSVASLQALTAATFIGGTLVHQFFLLSGLGLALAYYRRGVDSWIDWGRRRFSKIIVPYWVAVILTFLALDTLHTLAPMSQPEDFGAGTLLAYLTLTRNFMEASWSMNVSLWFIPVIVGLYIAFPFLIPLLDRFGPLRFMLIAIAITLGSVLIALVAGYPMTHQASVFLFHLAPFAAGCVLAEAISRRGFVTESLATWRWILVGVSLVALSAALVKLFSWGSAVNDLFTVVGMFLIGLSFVVALQRYRIRPAFRFLELFGKHSYVVYLIHLPLIQFVAKPILLAERQYVASPLLLLMELLSIPILLLIAMVIQPPLMAFAGRIETALGARSRKPRLGS